MAGESPTYIPGPLYPVPHVHLAIERPRCVKMFVRPLRLLGQSVSRAEPVVAMSGERAHPEFVGEGQGGKPKVSLGSDGLPLWVQAVSKRGHRDQ
jgi:hypothetical protein